MRQQPGRRTYIKEAANVAVERVWTLPRKSRGGGRKSGLTNVPFPAQKRESLGFLFYSSVIIQK